MRDLLYIELTGLRQTADNLLTGLVFYALTLGIFGYLLSPMVNLRADLLLMILSWPTVILALLLAQPGRIKRLTDSGIIDRLRQMGHSPARILMTVWGIRCGIITIGLGTTTLVALIIVGFHAPPTANGDMVFLLSLLIGIPGLSALIQFGDILGLVNHTGGALMAILVLPLALPLMIFGAGIGLSDYLGRDITASFPIFIGLTLIVGVVSLVASTIIFTRYAHE
jgi:heme exporter protein B